MSFNEETLGKENFTVLPFTSQPQKTFTWGIIATWVFAFVILIAGVWQVTLGSMKDCNDAACSLGEITDLSIGLMLILTAGFMAFIGFFLLTKTRERVEETKRKEEEILRQALEEK